MELRAFNFSRYSNVLSGLSKVTGGLRFLPGILLILCAYSKTIIAQTTEGPNSASSTANVTLSGSSSSWSNTGNALTSNDSYATAVLSSNGDFSDYIQITDFGFSLSATDIVLGIEVEIERFGSNAKDHHIRIIKNGTVGTTDRSVNPSWSNNDNDSYQTYGTSTDLWGETWTATDINASNFGIAISAVKQGGGGSSTASIDHVRITVHFDTALPVSLLSFSGNQTQNQVELEWATAWEENNSHFEIQRSQNGLDFETIGFQAGGHTSQQTLQYKFQDTSPLSGDNYYRLKQHDFNGDWALSELIRVAYEPAKVNYSLQPTLIREAATLYINDTALSDYSLTFISRCGKKIKSIKPRQSSTVIPRSTFPKTDVYAFCLLHRGEKVMSGKVLVK